jgi:L-fuconolactonase
VLDHLAFPPIASGDLSAWGGALLTMAELPNLCAKLSGLVTEADWHTWSIDDLRHPVELAVDAFGPSRLMLGSDWPTCLLAGSYTDAIDPLRYLVAELPTLQQDEIRGGTAVRVYQLGGRGAREAARSASD